MRFSLRTLLAFVVVAALASIAIRWSLQPNYKETIRGCENFGDHALIYGDDESGFLWGIVFPDNNLNHLGEYVGMESGHRVSVTGQYATITGTDGESHLKLRDGIVYVYRSPQSVTRFNRIDGITYTNRTFFNRWINGNMTLREMTLPKDFSEQVGLADSSDGG